jgi:hypothetical protein
LFTPFVLLPLMDPTDTRSPPTPTAAGVRRHAAAYVADLLATCQLRGAFTLEEADGLLGVVRGLETLAATEEEETDDNDTEAAHTGDAEGGHGDDHGQAADTPDPTLHSPLWPHAWERLTLAQARGKLSLREAWSVYNAMQLCGGDDEAASTADDAAAEATAPTDGAPATGGGGAGGGGAWTA